MTEKFEIGEVAIVVKCFHNPALEGTEVTITGPLTWRPTATAGHVRAYKTSAPSKLGGWFVAEPFQLRKKAPPARESLSTWDDVIVWRPKAKELVS
jgi:hypothetical protein